MASTVVPDRDAEVARKTISFLLKEGLSPAPANYEIMYAYYFGDNPDLRAELDKLRADKTPLNDPKMAELRSRFLRKSEQDEAVSRANDEILTAVGHIMSAVADMGRETGQFGGALSDFSGNMNVHNIKELAEAIEQMAQETRHMADKNRKLDAELARTAESMSRMREDLQQIQLEAMTDGLTGIANRKTFDQRLGSAVDHAGTSNEPLCLLMVDIDYFKKFNDKWGHQVGDEVLRLVAKMLESTVPEPGIPARYGGEEFGVILPTYTLDRAKQVGDKMRDVMSRKRIIRRKTNDDLGIITISVGGAQFVPGEAMGELIQRADSALYAAKQQGRNRVVVNPANPNQWSPV